MNRIEYLEYSLDGELYHHGVKGMKWGVRKAKKAQNLMRKSDKLRVRAAKLDSKSYKKSINSGEDKKYKKKQARVKKLNKKAVIAEAKAKKFDQKVYERELKAGRSDSNAIMLAEMLTGSPVSALIDRGWFELVDRSYARRAAKKASRDEKA